MISRAGILFALTAALLTGCATNGEVARVKETAMNAERKADEALSAAQEAKRAADDANMRASRTEEMLNRGFKKSMYK